MIVTISVAAILLNILRIRDGESLLCKGLTYIIYSFFHAFLVTYILPHTLEIHMYRFRWLNA